MAVSSAPATSSDDTRRGGVPGLGWFGIVRLGLVQTALGAIVVLMTSAINRVMVVELAWPAFIPGALIALHYGVQVLRPRWGYGSDMGGRRTPWIIGGMATLGLGGIGASVAILVATASPAAGVLLAVLAFLLVGLGVGAAGTSLLVLLATRVDPARRAAAATVVWVMMIAGFAVTAPLAGHFLDPFTPMRLVEVTATVAVVAVLVACLAVAGVEGRAPAAAPSTQAKAPFLVALREVWDEPEARRFTVFIFVSMLAYSAQELILEPFAGIVFGWTVGTTTKLAGVQHGGVLLGMIAVGVVGTGVLGRALASLRLWTVGGCVGSCIALVAIASGGWIGETFPLRVAVFALGVANGAFAVAAIGSMMGLAGSGSGARAGTRMGLWGAAQAVAFGLGGFVGTLAVDVARRLIEEPAHAYAAVFVAEGLLFLVGAAMAARIGTPIRAARTLETRPGMVRRLAEASHG